jgi:hypothetical protein
MSLSSAEFNQDAEWYYREGLRQAQLGEALQYLREELSAADQQEHSDLRGLLRCGVRVQDPIRFVDGIRERLVRDELSKHEIASVLNLLLIFTAEQQRDRSSKLIEMS